MKSLRSIGTATLITAILLPSLSAPAQASGIEGDVASSAKTVENLLEIAPEVFEDKHTNLQVTNGEVTAEVFEQVSKNIDGKYVDSILSKETTVPLDPSSSIKIGGLLGAPEVGIFLPFSDETESAVVLKDGTTVFDHQNGSSSTPVVKTDGSVQITTTISERDAPTRYSYESDVDGAETIDQLENGTLIFRDANGEYLAAIAPAWAKDANGVEVPTWYEVDGLNITQVVDHASQSGLTYPVIADPYLGRDLFSWTNKGTERGLPKYSALKSPFGNMTHLPGAGWVIFANQGWNELKAKQPGVTAKSSLKHQYDCHVTGGYFNTAGDWNLEQFRYDNAGWIARVATHMCNW